MDIDDIAPLSLIRGSREERRQKIMEFESSIQQMDDVEHMTTLKHAFLDGAYFRQITIPAGVALTGKIHSQNTINMLTKGAFAIVTEFDEQVIEAPFMYISKPGTKKACYTIRECIFINCHTTWKTDLKAIEAEVTSDAYPEIGEDGQSCPGGFQVPSLEVP